MSTALANASTAPPAEEIATNPGFGFLAEIHLLKQYYHFYLNF